jgi:hypothetical protein
VAKTVFRALTPMMMVSATAIKIGKTVLKKVFMDVSPFTKYQQDQE